MFRIPGPCEHLTFERLDQYGATTSTGHFYPEPHNSDWPRINPPSATPRRPKSGDVLAVEFVWSRILVDSRSRVTLVRNYYNVVHYFIHFTGGDPTLYRWAQWFAAELWSTFRTGTPDLQDIVTSQLAPLGANLRNLNTGERTFSIIEGEVIAHRGLASDDPLPWRSAAIVTKRGTAQGGHGTGSMALAGLTEVSQDAGVLTPRARGAIQSFADDIRYKASVQIVAGGTAQMCLVNETAFRDKGLIQANLVQELRVRHVMGSLRSRQRIAH